MPLTVSLQPDIFIPCLFKPSGACRRHFRTKVQIWWELHDISLRSNTTQWCVFSK